MSRRGPSIDFNPLLEKVQCDVSFLSYLGLHQYAKDQKLIGRSRPMITKGMDFVKQRRLNFRLLVACIQQIVGRTHFDHNGRIEQINYVNVGNYSQLRLYGLLDREIFALDTSADTTLTGWWPSQLSFNDAELLGSDAGMATIVDHLSYNARATLEVGGAIFTKHLRKALRFIPESLTHTAPHSQRDPRNRMKVKNLSLNLQLVESRSYTGGTNRPPPGRGLHIDRNVGFVDVPCHIERLLHFRDVLWPWIQTLATPEAREAFTYVKSNYPGVQAIQVKIREIRSSVAEVQRREQTAEEERVDRETAQAQLRDRLVATYGEPDPGIEVDEHGEDIPNNVTLELRGLEDGDGPEIEHIPVHRMGQDEPVDHVPGYHGRELEEPGTAFNRRIEENREEIARVHEGLMFANEDEPYRRHVHAEFIGDEIPATPGVRLDNPPDHVHDIADCDMCQTEITLAEGDRIDPLELPPIPTDDVEGMIEGVRERIARVLGIPIEEEGE